MLTAAQQRFSDASIIYKGGRVACPAKGGCDSIKSNLQTHGRTDTLDKGKKKKTRGDLALLGAVKQDGLI